MKWISLGQLYKNKKKIQKSAWDNFIKKKFSKIDLGQLYKKKKKKLISLYTHISKFVTIKKEL